MGSSFSALSVIYQEHIKLHFDKWRFLTDFVVAGYIL